MINLARPSLGVDLWTPRRFNLPNATVALTGSLVAYYQLEETGAANRVDATGRGNTLAPINTPNATGGVIANAIQLVAASSQRVQSNTNSDLQTGDVDFTIAAWVWLASKSDIRYIVTKDSAVNPNREFAMYYDNSTDRYKFETYNGSGSTRTATANVFGSPATGAWHFVVGWHDAVNDTVNIQVNLGSTNSASTAAMPIAAGTSQFVIGFRQGGSAARHMDGRIDEVGYWKRVLTQREIRHLYKGYAGRTYPFG